VSEAAASQAPGNVYDVGELGGAFGDLGTFVPFVVGYLAVTGLDPGNILVPFGLAQIAVGLFYRTPLAVQPMKAIASAAVGQPTVVTAGAIQAAGLFTGVLWLALGLTGVASRLARLAGRPVVNGLVLGLALALGLEGVRMAAADPVVGFVAGAVVLTLLSRAAAGAMLVLLALGLGLALGRAPALAADLAGAAWDWRLPALGLHELDWRDAVTGVVVLALPQAALTFGNAVVATAEENNTIFPDRPVTVRRLAVNHGLMNLLGATLGGVPMCHGAGGMAGHLRFGARTGGALVILGSLTLIAGLGFADALGLLLRAFPAGVLGIVLLVGSLELAASVQLGDARREERYITFATAALGMWNMGLGFAVGALLWYGHRRAWLRA
jgi:MFS superfamily sulfate permease-like transporter